MNSAIEQHLQLASALRDRVELLDKIACALIDCLSGGGCVYLAGNGGSAADAQHIAAELVGRFKLDRPALAAVALTTDTSTLTAVGNDLGFERVFARQVEALVTDRDLFWALSVSGRSANIVSAARLARQRGARCIGFTSRSGGTLAELCHYSLMVPHTDSDRVQEIHQLAYHLVCARVEQAADDGRITPRGSSSNVST